MLVRNVKTFRMNLLHPSSGFSSYEFLPDSICPLQKMIFFNNKFSNFAKMDFRSVFSRAVTVCDLVSGYESCGVKSGHLELSNCSQMIFNEIIRF